MTKNEFKERFIQSGKLIWDKIEDIDFDVMYNDLNFIDSTVSELFEVPIELVIKKRKILGISFKKEDYSKFMLYKQQGYLKWDEINYNRLNYLYNKCNFPDATIAALFDVSKRTVTNKRKEFGISILFNAINNVLQEPDHNDVSSYLDFIN